MEAHGVNTNLVALSQALILLLVALLMWGGHYFPWHIIPALVEPTGKRELKRLVAYAYGVGVIWLGCVAYAVTRQVIGLEPVVTIGELTAVISAAAIGTVLPRIVKHIRDAQVELSEKQHG